MLGMTISQIKAKIRTDVLARRDALDDDYRVNAAQVIAGYAASFEMKPNTIVSGYFPIRSEIDVQPLLACLEAQGAKLCLPVVLDRETIVFRQYNSDTPLIDAGFGTKAPAADAPILDPDVMLMPLAAFDAAGNRIGYGAGHYDRAIAKLHADGASPSLIGCAFECQFVNEVPADVHDVRLHTVLTEKHVYKAEQ